MSVVTAEFRYRTLDVFTANPFEGNPLAVFPDARGIDDVTMGRIANELHLSETVFVLPSEDDLCVARLRIFTPGGELPFAGHPTVGTAFVLADEGVVDPACRQFFVRENVGPVSVRLERSATIRAWLTTPPITFGATFEARACVAALGLSADDVHPRVVPQIVSAGVPGLFIGLRDRAAVDRAVLDLAAMHALMSADRAREFFIFTPEPEGAYSRMFAPELGVPEDPATGGLTGPLAALMMRAGVASDADGTRFVSEQGTAMGRRSFVHVAITGHNGTSAIEIGGDVTPMATGIMTLPRAIAKPVPSGGGSRTSPGYER